MANTFYTPEQVARVAVAMAADESYLSALVNRDFEADLLGGGGKGRTVNVRVPAALIGRSRDIDDKTTAIVLDELTETTVPVTLGTHAYNAIGLSEGDLSLNIADFSAQVLRPQVEAVVAFIEEAVADAIAAVAEDETVAYDPADPVPTFTELRKILRKRGVPISGINAVVGAGVYADLLNADAIVDASQSASTAALRDGNIGRVMGMTVVESTLLADGVIAAFHRDAFTLAVRAPLVPAGASFGQTVNERGFSLRYLRDYDASTMKDRSIVSTFVGVAQMPLYGVTRDYTANTATVEKVAGGAVVKVDTETAPV